MQEEKREYLREQIITYIGNKRKLLPYIDIEVKKICSKLGKKPLITCDLFSGSGIVARLLKRYSSLIIANDLEEYSAIINSCYLTNAEDFAKSEYVRLKKLIYEELEDSLSEGIIAKNYAPKNSFNIKAGERVFYSRENALRIDTFRCLIDKLVPEELQKFFLAPLITEASIHTNTGGVFKGFYKSNGIGQFGGKGRNALERILGLIELNEPVLSNFSSSFRVLTEDALKAATILKEEGVKLDICYIDPPYNEHPYGSNYFMLNLILKNRIDGKLSKTSGIEEGWKRSAYNNKLLALKELESVISLIDATYLIISYNSEGNIMYEDMVMMLSKYGELEIRDIKYNAFRASRNLHKRERYVSEYLFILKKSLA